MLNENNIMACFLFNPEKGKYMPVKKEGTIELEYNNNQIKVNTDIIAIDLGYTIDASIKDITFKINNKTLAIKTLSLPENLTDCTINNNECAIITDNQAFKSIVWINKENIGKIFYYNILTCNSTLSSYDIDFIAKKINNIEPKYLENTINKLEHITENILRKLEILDADLYQAESDISSIREELSNIDKTNKQEE